MALVGPALGAPVEIELRASVSADLHVVRGTIATSAPATFLDPLARLPVPTDDRTLFRTFPNAANTGSVTWEALSGFPGTWRFTARLPDRFGDIGVLPGRGMWADGGWYPQPVDARGAPLVASWNVSVVLPEGAVGVVDGVVGEGRVAWRGLADRAALAVLPKAHVTTLPVGGGRLRLVERGRPERGTARQVIRAIEEAWPLPEAPDLTVVEDLDLLRLARAAPGMVYLSDRAFRVTPGITSYHREAVRLAVAAAALQAGRPAFADGWTRDFGAAALTGALPTPSARKLLGWFAWNPLVDALLYNGTLPYFADLFDEAFGGPPGLFELLGGRAPGRVAALQLDDLRGKGTAATLARAMLQGATLADAAAAMAVPPALVEAWGRPYAAAQDYAVKVDATGKRVERSAPADAPPEVVVVEVDGAPLAPWVTGPGPATLSLPAGANRVRVDPGGHVREAELANDRWPDKWTVVLNGGFYNLAATQGAFDLFGQAYLRRQNDSRNLFLVGAEHDAEDLVSFEVGWVRWLGPLLDRRTRAHRLSLYAGPALLDPSFRPTDRGSIAIDGSLGYAWDTRTDDYFALSGHRYAVAVNGGFVPESEERWAGASMSLVQLYSPHPRHVFALRARAGWVSGDVEHRLLPLGGPGDVRAVPEPAVLGNERLSASLEYRVAPIRNASVPGGLLWLSEVQLSPGIDAGVAWHGDTRYAAVGATLGLHVLTDLLGTSPSLAGVTIAAPLWTEGFARGPVQLYVDFSHAF
jgi:hypothetical protein